MPSRTEPIFGMKGLLQLLAHHVGEHVRVECVSGNATAGTIVSVSRDLLTLKFSETERTIVLRMDYVESVDFDR